MRKGIQELVVLTVIVASILVGCGRDGTSTGKSQNAAASFGGEFSLAVRAGRDQLTGPERKDLLAANHPLLFQLADPNTVKLLQLFAKLPDASHGQLQSESYLKWNVADLDAGRQQVLRDLIQLNLDMAARQGAPANPAFSLKALARAQTGFAVVSIEGTDQTVVSWYVLWPELSDPTWVTVVNARAAGTPPYFQAHMQRLPLLRTLETSALPVS
jgi:hypothetical protein